MIRKLTPRTLQGRLTLGFAGVVALSLFLVTIFVLNRLDDEFRSQQQVELRARTERVAAYVDSLARQIMADQPVVTADNGVARPVVAALSSEIFGRLIADLLAEADVDIVLGLPTVGSGDAIGFVPAPNGRFHIAASSPGRPGLTKEALQAEPREVSADWSAQPFVIFVQLSNPYTFRQTAIDNVTTVTAAVGTLALGIAVIVAAAMALRVTTPLRRLTEASRALAEGDLTSRIPRSETGAGSSELQELATQFNAMADQLEESVEIIRRDRDRSRDFLADVSHELRTPIAALLTFNELLTERAGDDPTARAEFLGSSRVQLERLDWLAQNLLELSKLDSGLVLLDLRPDDVRAAVETAIEQAGPAARRRGVALSLEPASAPIRLRHDPQRIGQVVTNLVGNAIKFTEPGGTVRVRVGPGQDGGAIIEVVDSGIGIEPAELPRIFERFYRGSLSNEARGSGSGLGLAIVHSIVDMHRGTVEVASRRGAGTTFTVTLPADPRREPGPIAGTTPIETGLRPRPTTLERDANGPKMADSSPGGAPGLNRETPG
ncbi:MAG: HAMP domain-containing histidine kinase [Chloroflexota bacterium]|nr:HAMP domain-containing histidine kinase [Chloroflexota bacterium]